MTGDSLDRIEGDARHVLTPGRANWGWEASLARDVLALVAVARVVRENEWMGTDEEVERGDLQRAWRQAGAALARLDGGPK